MFCVRGEVSASFWGVLVGEDLDDEVGVGEFGDPALDGAGGCAELFGKGAVFVPHEAFSAGLTDDGDKEEFWAKGKVGVLKGLFDEYGCSGAWDVEVREEEEGGVLFFGHGGGGQSS